jgi:hypothetical protein
MDRIKALGGSVHHPRRRGKSNEGGRGGGKKGGREGGREGEREGRTLGKSRR